jgi:hypothetical protein
VITVLFWNINRSDLGGLAAAIAQEHDVDIVLAAECVRPGRLLKDLNRELSRKFNYQVVNSERRIEVFSRLPRRSIQLLDEAGLSFMRVSPPIGTEVLIVGAHLASKRFKSDPDQAFRCIEVARTICAYEERVGHSRTVLVGDLNMNPFEHGVVTASGLHAVMSRRAAQESARVVGGKEYQFFYNPMWSHFGDRGPSPPGTYYYRGSSETTFFWNIFDQVLVRPELLATLGEEDVRVLTSAGGRSLLRADGRPDKQVASDHLPIVFSLNDSAANRPFPPL